MHETAERHAMIELPYILDAPRRTVVCEAFVEISREKG